MEGRANYAVAAQNVVVYVTQRGHKAGGADAAFDLLYQELRRVLELFAAGHHGRGDRVYRPGPAKIICAGAKSRLGYTEAHGTPDRAMVADVVQGQARHGNVTKVLSRSLVWVHGRRPAVEPGWFEPGRPHFE